MKMDPGSKYVAEAIEMGKRLAVSVVLVVVDLDRGVEIAVAQAPGTDLSPADLVGMLRSLADQVEGEIVRACDEVTRQ